MSAPHPPESPLPVESASIPPAPGAGRGVWLRIGLGITLAVVGVAVLGRQISRSMPQAPLPVMGEVTQDLAATERDGRMVQLSALRGKVTVLACLYTVCPHGCAAVVAEMRKLNAAHRTHPDFHQVSLALAPERDSASFLKAYAEGVGVAPGDPWWFVTAPQKTTWDFVSRGLQLREPAAIPEEKRINPLDLYEHDLRMVLVDRRGRIRGYYDVFHPQPEIASLMVERLDRDVQRLLDDPAL